MTRLEDQICWYSMKSSQCQTLYKRFQTAEIILASLISVMAGLNSVLQDCKSIILVAMSLFGAAIAVIESTCKMNKYHENWIQYRYISEILKHEKYLYLTKTAPYNEEEEEEAFQILVERTERTISSENVNWVGLNSDKK